MHEQLSYFTTWIFLYSFLSRCQQNQQAAYEQCLPAWVMVYLEKDTIRI